MFTNDICYEITKYVPFPVNLFKTCVAYSKIGLNESFWEIKLFNDYGIKRKIHEQWKSRYWYYLFYIGELKKIHIRFEGTYVDYISVTKHDTIQEIIILARNILLTQYVYARFDYIYAINQSGKILNAFLNFGSANKVFRALAKVDTVDFYPIQTNKFRLKRLPNFDQWCEINKISLDGLSRFSIAEISDQYNNLLPWYYE